MKQPLGAPSLSHGEAAGLTLADVEAQVCTGTYVTRYSYDEQGKLLSVTDAAGGLTSYVYDAARNLVAKQDANGNLTTYEYDVRNLRTAEHQHLDSHARLTTAQRSQVPLFEAGATPSGSVGTLTWRHTYDANGNPDSMTDPKGQVTVPGYGLLDRLAVRTYSQHAQPRELPSVDAEGFAYDGNGNLGHATLLKQTPGGVVEEATTYTYDALDRVKTRLREQDGKQLSFGYDAMGHRTSVTDSDGVVTGYAYDALGRLSQATLPVGVVEYRYWPDSLLKGVVWPNGLSEGRCYDAAGRLVELVTARGTVSDTCQVSGSVVSRFVYTYDANGNRLTQVETRTAPSTQVLGVSETTRYGYDALNRLTGVAGPDTEARLYRLDAVGNRTGERRISTTRWARGLGPSAYFSVESKSLTRDITGTFNRVDWLTGFEDARDATRATVLNYDLVGNLVEKATQDGSRTFAWDIRNTLTAVYDNGQEVGRYDYDNNLQRTQRHTASEDVAYVLDDGFILQELDGTQVSHPSKRRYHYGGGPLAVSEVASAATNFLGTDALGSVTDALSTSGDVTAARQYDAWGNPRGGSAPSAGEFKLGYTGHQYDVETGLTYARARYYDSELGRFISRDSYEGQLSDAPSLHRYAYAHANPLGYRDDDGHSATAVGAAAGFFWGAGQMATTMGRDLIDGRSRNTTEYLSLWGQNIIGGAEIGASIDLTVASGGTLALAGSGALGGSGFNAITFDGEAKDWSEFAAEQRHGAAWGAAGGVVFGKAAPLLARVPIVKEAVEKVSAAGTKFVGRYVASAGDEVVTAAPNIFNEMGFGFGNDINRIVAESIQQGLKEAANGGAVVAPELPVGGWARAPSGGLPRQVFAEAEAGFQHVAEMVGAKKTAGATADATKALSGWTPRPGYEQGTDRALQLANEMGYTFRPNRLLDQGVPGRYSASHVEPQMSVVRPNEPLGVSKDMCTSCQDFYEALAKYRQAEQVVRDPSGTWVFTPEGMVMKWIGQK
ncbi:RHS repeat domain-containing protein [Corallococcus sp. 4LFB]|uniref:RHS repeat domain-containing protein n=1 Tax=Corallococcus sp. 4LFB TaxID=3383249 RepID=UPI0039752D37